MHQQLTNHLMQEEGEILHAYKDHLGYWTIGVGRLIDNRRGGGITHEEAQYLLQNDIKKHTKIVLEELPWAEFIGDARLGALISMHFQMGNSLFDFKVTLGHMARNEWDEAAVQMLKSKWAQQTPNRDKRVSEMVRTNSWQNQ